MGAHHHDDLQPLRDELTRLRTRSADASWVELCDRFDALLARQADGCRRCDALDAAEKELERACDLHGIDRSGGAPAGVVHHFNNVLMGVLGASRMAARSMQGFDPARPYVDEIAAQAERGVHFSRELIDAIGAPARKSSVRTGARARLEADESAADEVESEGDSKPRAHILLVEDERLIRITLKHELQALGYAVECACDGCEATNIISQRTEPIDVLLTDVVMPGPTGPEIAALALKKWPASHVIFMSAYPHDLLVQQGRISASQATLEKPFTEEQLLGKLREALKGNGAAA